MQEWQAYIEADRCLTLDENLSVPNPFKPGELLVIPRWPGRAMLTIGGSSAHIEYRHGCLSLIDECPLAAHLAYMRRIAEDLNANVI
jgi:hypothetical protein